MYVNKMDSNNSALIGKKGENLFERCIKKYKGIKIIEADYNQNVYEHWDYKLESKNNSLTVDVKAMKRKSRWDGDPQDEYIWVEFKNVSGNDGWLYGKADCLAFQCNEGFIVVNRKLLTKKCEKLIGYTKDELSHDMVDTKSLSTKKREPYKLYNRRDRKDVISIITKQDLLDTKHVLLRK